jgi:hypothetical protein
MASPLARRSRSSVSLRAGRSTALVARRTPAMASPHGGGTRRYPSRSAHWPPAPAGRCEQRPRGARRRARPFGGPVRGRAWRPSQHTARPGRQPRCRSPGRRRPLCRLPSPSPRSRGSHVLRPTAVHRVAPTQLAPPRAPVQHDRPSRSVNKNLNVPDRNSTGAPSRALCGSLVRLRSILPRRHIEVPAVQRTGSPRHARRRLPNTARDCPRIPCGCSAPPTRRSSLRTPGPSLGRRQTRI